MNTKLSLGLRAISVTLGCSRNVRLYPVHGQLAAQTPSPVLIAKITSGSGFYVSHVLGKNFYAQGSASGNHGTVVQMEMYMPEAEHTNNTEIKGVAKDTKANIYKLVS